MLFCTSLILIRIFSPKKTSRCSSLIDWNCLKTSIFSDLWRIYEDRNSRENDAVIMYIVTGGEESQCGMKGVQKWRHRPVKER